MKLADGLITTFPLKIDLEVVTSQEVSGQWIATHYFLFRTTAFHMLTKVYPSFRIIFALPSCKKIVSHCGICYVKRCSHLLAHQLPVRFHF